MAIEKEPNNILNSQNTLEGTEDMQIAIEAIEEAGQEDFEIQEDGSAILNGMDDMPMDTGFDSNIAESLDDDTLNGIATELTSGIEKDKSSREDWEKTYTDGLKYLGMKFDQERSEPFEGASGVIHPLLGEAVTNFQAQAYKELLPSNGPVKTQVIGKYDSVVEEQAQRVKDFMNYQITHVMEEFDEELDQMLFYLPLGFYVMFFCLCSFVLFAFFPYLFTCFFIVLFFLCFRVLFLLLLCFALCFFVVCYNTFVSSV